MNHLFYEPYFIRAIFACISMSIVCPLLGVFLVLKRMSLIGDAISHAILPGVAIGFVIGGLSMLYMGVGGLVTGCIIILAAVLTKQNTILKYDASLAGFYLTSLAFGVVIITKFGSNIDLLHVLFGSILLIDTNSVIALFILTVISVFTIIIIMRPLVLSIIDERILQRSTVYHITFLFVVVANLICGFQALGTLLTIGLMIIPAITARLITRSITIMIFISIAFGIIGSLSGLLVSYYFDLATGPSVVLACGLMYILVVILHICLKSR